MEELEKKILLRSEAWNSASMSKFASVGTLSNNYTNPYNDNLIYSGYSRETILSALNNIIRNEISKQDNLKTIRDFSRFLYATDDAYGMAISDFVGSVLWVNTLAPNYNPKSTVDKSASKEKINLYLSSAFNKETLSDILLTLILNGIYIGYETGNSKRALIQHLPIEYCRIVGKINDVYEVKFDFSYFDNKHPEVLEYYPDIFKIKYNAYTKDNLDKWQKLPYDKTFVFTLPMETPLFIGSFKNILLKYKSDGFLEEGLGSENIKFAHQKVPINTSTGDILTDENLTAKFHGALSNKLPKNVIAVTSPFDIKLDSFTENKMSTIDEKRNYINNQVLKSVGASEANFGVAKSQSGYKIYTRTLEGRLNLILQQISKRITFQINNMDNKAKTLTFNYTIFPITTQNREEWFDNTYKLYKDGGSIMLPYQIALGLDFEDIKAILYMEKSEEVESLLHEREKKSGYEPKGERIAVTDDGESSQDRDLKGEL